MIFSNNWLKEWIDHQLSDVELTECLTMGGLEVDGISAVANPFKGVVVSEIEMVNPHPSADKLRLCSVTDGKEKYQVVCGASNVKVGMRAPFAKAGAEITLSEEEKPLVIEVSEIRGIESMGMLCSAQELGLEEKSEGIFELPSDAPIGKDIRSFLSLDDFSVGLDLTPNRGDCLGMIGLAREVGVLVRKGITEPENFSIESAINDEYPISIVAKNGCPRYLGRVIKNINIDTSSPLWLKEKLRRSGLRSIDPIVDVTNFILIELGQPMHAFDFSKLSGGINVRMAKESEKLTLLDGKNIALNPEVLVIADDEKVVAMAGIMGGLETSVTESTTDVFLECAYFDPLTIAGRARAFGMHTDASHRYERGVDYELQHRAMERATGLLLEIVGGEAGPITEVVGNLPEPKHVRLKYKSVASQLGIKMPRNEIREILERLGFKVVRDNEELIELGVPSYRFDISIEADLIEEIARIYGYNNIPQTVGMGQQTLNCSPEEKLPLRNIRRQLTALGYQEVITYSFVDLNLSKMVMGLDFEHIALQNPISEDLAVMRGSLIPGLLSTFQYNANRQQNRLRIFETGLVFHMEGGKIVQRAMLGGLIAGRRLPETWANDQKMNDFYDLKGDVEALLNLKGESCLISFESAKKSGFHPGQCAQIVGGTGDLIGYLGALHPSITRQVNADSNIYIFELVLNELQKTNIPRTKELSKYPEVSRDIAIVTDENTSSSEILSNVEKSAGEFLINSRIFDVYQGDAVAKGKKSIALGLTWQHPSRTLSDEEINTIIRNCVNALQDQFNAELRN